MKQKGNLFKSMKEVKKTVKEDLFEVGAALVGGIVGDIAYTKGKEQLPENYRKYTGAAVGLAGAGLAVFSKNSKMKAGAFGMIGSASTNILNDLAPEMSAKIGLSGLADTTGTETETPGFSDLEKDMLKTYMAEAEKVETETTDLIPGVQE